MNQRRIVQSFCLLLLLQLALSANCFAGWVKEYTKPGGIVSYKFRDLSPTGELFITYSGNWSNQSSYHLSSIATLEISKIDSQGVNQWNNRYVLAGPAGDMNIYPRAIKATTDGGCLVIGRSWDYNENAYYEMPYLLFIKLDRNGEVEWSHRYEHGWYTTKNSMGIDSFVIIQTTDGGYAVKASAMETLDGKSGRVLRFDHNGNLKWQKRFHLGTNPGFRDLGGFIGMANSLDPIGLAEGADDSILVFSRGYNYSSSFLFVTKLDTNGALLWQRKSNELIVVSGNHGAYKPTPDGGFIVLGATATSPTAIVKFDANGEIEWQKSIYSSAGSYAHSISLSADNGYVIGYSDVHYSPGIYVHMVKLDQFGNILWERGFDDTAPFMGTYELEEVDGTYRFVNYYGPVNGVVLSLLDANGHLSNCIGSFMVPNHETGPLDLAMSEVEAVSLDGIYSEVEGAEILHQPAALNMGSYCNLPPVANAGPDQSLACAGKTGTPVQLDGSGSSDPDGDELTYDWEFIDEFGTIYPASGVAPVISLPRGLYSGNLTVTDTSGEFATDSNLIAITDTVAPQTSVVSSGTEGLNGWYVSDVLIEFLATDNCAGCQEIHVVVDGSETITSGNTANTLISLEGVHAVDFWAIDRAGNAETPDSLSIPLDRTPPVIALPADMTVEAESASGSVVSYSVTATDNIDQNPALSCTPVSGSTFAIGTTPVECTSSDAAGNTGYASFGITVADTTPPVVIPPADVIVKYCGNKTVVDLGVATATDAVGVDTIVNDSPSIFPKGTTVVTWTATDIYGNVGIATQSVSLIPGLKGNCGYNDDDHDDDHDGDDNGECHEDDQKNKNKDDQHDDRDDDHHEKD